MIASTAGSTADRESYGEPPHADQQLMADAADAVGELYAREELAHRRQRTEEAIRRAETAR